MGQRIDQAQSELLNDGYLDSLAQSRKDSDTMQLTELEKVLIASGVDFVDRVMANLDRLGKNDTGELFDGIAAGELIGSPDSGYRLDIGYEDGSNPAKYYDYVNKGVSGTTNKINSPYGYKDKMPPISVMADWVKRNNIASRNDDQRYNTSTLQDKRKSVSQVAGDEQRIRSLAYAIARAIFRRGLKKTDFFDDAVVQIYGKDIMEPLSKAVAADVKVYIRQLDFLINKNNKKD